MEKEINRVKKVMSENKKILAAYLFGSTASRKTGPLSDIDIAVLMKNELNSKERSDLKLRLISELTDIFNSDRIDLVVLNNAPIQLTFEIISSGQVIYGKREDVSGFEARASSRYHDRKYYIDRYTQEIIKRTAERGFE